ncbi:MAG TPA: LamG-like jellyroll fold domain-containing protein [Bryobacteraceae bacterium]|nr:LamG-like jellyroll fold domain-containing protein [Bryobacteraceae bacterium]
MGRRVYRTGNVEVDIGLQCVRRDGEVYHLRAQSFDALVYLIEHRGAIVGKEELVSRLWGDRAVTDNSLAQCMNDIRKALGDDPRQPRFLRTIPRSGYCFVSEVEAPAEEPPPEPGSAQPTPTPPRKSRTFRLLALCTGLAAVLVAGVFTLRFPNGKTMGELAWWRMDEGSGDRIHDSSGHGLQGTVHGPVHWVNDARGPTLEFGGISTFVEGKDARGLPVGNAPRTITAWVRHAAPLADSTSILHYGELTGGRMGAFGLALDPNGRVEVIGPPAQERSLASIRAADDQWHFVAMTYDGSSVHTFVDGSEDRHWTSPEPMNTGSSSGWNIGKYLLGGTPFRGAIRDVRVLGRALGQLELLALLRCTSGKADLRLAGGSYFFLPIYREGAVISESGEIANSGRDFGGVQIARAEGGCSVTSLRGADLGQNLEIHADLLVPTDGTHITTAGLYFRSRKAAPGDGLIGGTSAGYSVELESDGRVRVWRLNPQAVVAFRPAAPGFDAGAFHALDLDVRGEFLQARLDHVAMAFQYGNKVVTSVPLPPEWEHAEPRGHNQGTVGVTFRTESRGLIGGQRVRNFTVRMF